MTSPLLKRLPCVSSYVKSWKSLKQMDLQAQVSVPGWVIGMPGWGKQTSTVQCVLQCIQKALQNRINERGGLQIHEHREGETNLWCDAQAIQNWHKSKIIIRHFRTRLAKKRFEHLIQKYDD